MDAVGNNHFTGFAEVADSAGAGNDGAMDVPVFLDWFARCHSHSQAEWPDAAFFLSPPSAQ